ncbi:multidrug efflux MFS transporter MdtG [Pluralibacter gergoviae]|uniref:multidrug efflux MFS transporter MdtG n=1 Tax=Pluralibacter gergoviae TaxID=61647 RepID=UPI0006508648|nr:multidrug efflux MFS transporter MdtG [Pluralibacter gergoviae]EKV6245698.1 multidrug efflux MFS transporter MdtG [Pluralibacter gergoviae]KMK07981.1 multidrug transporter [Pluralibacter gergoviae]
MHAPDTPINWKQNLAIAWVGCFLTGAGFSLVMPFLPLYVEQLGVTGHGALNMWSGLVFSITFLFSAIASPFWGGLADRKGRKIMLLRSALGMSIVMVLMGVAQNIWQFLILRALLGLLGGYVPNANALLATQIPRHKSGWALGTLSTGTVSGALLGPLAGGWLADQYGLRPVFLITASVLFLCFLLTLFFIREQFVPVNKKEMLRARAVFASLKSPRLVLSLFVTTLIIQVATGSIAPILTLYVRELAGNVSNIAFISGMIASVPGVAALLSAPRLGKLGDRIGPEKILIASLVVSVLLLVPMAFVQAPWQLGVLRFLLGAADGALLPAVQTLLIYNASNQVAGRIFSYNQSFRDIGNVTGPLIGAAVSASYGFRSVFFVTAGVVLFNAIYTGISMRRARRGR